MKNYIYRCDLSKQYKLYKAEIDRKIADVLKKGVYTLGREVGFFEEEFSAYTGRSYGVSVASGTDALILALKVAGIKKGDGVITSTYAPVPVPTAVVLAGGVPVFADIEEDTALIDPCSIESRISDRVRFILPVHIFGSVCSMNTIKRIAARKRLILIEDAAQAHGSNLSGKKAGSFGMLSCFSFYPTKNLGGYGDGGIILTDSRKTAKRLKLLRNYGKKYNPFNSESLGFNSRLDELQAAILRVKLRHLDEMNDKRRALVELYRKELQDTPLTFLKAYAGGEPNCHILTVLCATERDGLLKFLEAHNIQANIYYPKPLHLMRAFRKYAGAREKFPVSEKMAKEAIALPLYPELGRKTVAFIAETIKKYFFNKGR